MMKILRRSFLTLAVAVASIGSVSAQELIWDVSFEAFFDNREYKSKINIPQTIFGARVAPEVGLRWNENHSLMIGYDLLANFGAKTFDKNGNEAFVYYQYSSPKYLAAAGIIPRRKIIGDYSGAFFSDSIKYYDPYISGLLLQYVGKKGYIEFGADWNSMLSDTKREKFLLFSGAQLRLGIAYLGYHLSMYHHAGTYLEDGVVDNILVYPHAGLDLARLTHTDKFNLRVGWLKAFQNDRKYVDKYVTPGGVQVELNVEKWKFGISNTLYAGKNLMPYWVAPKEGLDYGPGLYWGEPFYRTSNVYDRLEVYWAPVQNDMMNLKVSTVHHFDGDIWNWQQKIVFTLNLGRHRFVPKK